VRRHAAYALSRLGQRARPALTATVATGEIATRDIAEEALASLRRSA
jgi:hypothetical protein